MGSLNSGCIAFSLTELFDMFVSEDGIADGGGIGFAKVCRLALTVVFFFFAAVELESSSVSSLLYLIHERFNNINIVNKFMNIKLIKTNIITNKIRYHKTKSVL